MASLGIFLTPLDTNAYDLGVNKSFLGTADCMVQHSAQIPLSLFSLPLRHSSSRLRHRTCCLGGYWDGSTD